MSKQDKISELFRTNAHKLEQHPSEATWMRLQQRLQKQRPIAERHAQLRPRGHSIKLSALNIAAGLALLIGLSAAFLWVINEQDRRYQHARAMADRPLVVEDLPVEEEAPRPSPMVQKSLERVYQAPQKVIEEGRAEQKLVARVSALPPPNLPVSPTPSDSAETHQRTGR